MKTTAIALAGLLAPATAFAHPGEHAHMAAAGSLSHFLSQPDHVAVVGLALALAAWPVTRLALRRVRK